VLDCTIYYSQKGPSTLFEFLVICISRKLGSFAFEVLIPYDKDIQLLLARGQKHRK